MKEKIKVGAVSYLNAKPLLYGLEKQNISKDIEIQLAYPSALVKDLQSGKIDIALLPSAALQIVPGSRIVGRYGIAADGEVASVSLFSQTPVDAIKEVYLDYQSRTSVRLAEILLKNHWKVNPLYLSAPENYIEYINGPKAGVIIGDRALKQKPNFAYDYDLAMGWKAFTGLPFVFAGWITKQTLPDGFIEEFDKANGLGLNYIDEIAAEYDFPYYSLSRYYRENIHYELDAEKLKGLDLFMNYLKSMPSSVPQ